MGAGPSLVPLARRRLQRVVVAATFIITRESGRLPSWGADPRPTHILGPIYQNTTEALHTSPYFISGLVGVGPYRLESFSLGIETLLTRFDDYYLGVPRINRIIFHYMQDPTTMVANILDGAVDILIPPGLDVEVAVDVQHRWEGTGNRMIVAGLQEDFASAYTVQQRVDLAKPRAATPVRPWTACTTG